jgi:hypothetical protein
MRKGIRLNAQRTLKGAIFASFPSGHIGLNEALENICMKTIRHVFVGVS